MEENSTRTPLDLDAIEAREAEIHAVRSDPAFEERIGAPLRRALASAADVPALLARVRELEKIEKAARWFALAAMDPDAPREVGPQVVADLLAAFGLPLPTSPATQSPR